MYEPVPELGKRVALPKRLISSTMPNVSWPLARPVIGFRLAAVSTSSESLAYELLQVNENNKNTIAKKRKRNSNKQQQQHHQAATAARRNTNINSILLYLFYAS